MIEAFTNTALATARLCPRKFELGYIKQLELDAVDAEALAVGSAWHKAHHWASRDAEHAAAYGDAAYDAIRRYAPGRLWNEKLGRLYAAQQAYMEPIDVVEAEHTFEVEFDGERFRGQIDGIIELPDGRRGVLERKTSGEDISPSSAYWTRLRLDVQVGLYFMAAELEGWRPEFILYDVVRKPTIRPARLGTKKDRQVMRTQLEKRGTCEYYGETFSAEIADPALEREEETIDFYGARLTADIGNRPDFYFQRRPVHRTTGDFEELKRDLASQIAALRTYESGKHFPRNPNACDAFGQCAFYALCPNNILPAGDVPTGFRKRAHLHPELVPDDIEEA